MLALAEIARRACGDKNTCNQEARRSHGLRYEPEASQETPQGRESLACLCSLRICSQGPQSHTLKLSKQASISASHSAGLLGWVKCITATRRVCLQGRQEQISTASGCPSSHLALSLPAA